MTNREQYRPSQATSASIDKTNDQWTLVVKRELNGPIDMVWTALTDPNHLRHWAPFEADRNLQTTGTVNFSTVGTPKPHISTSTIRRAEAPHLLEYLWGDQFMRWELEKIDNNRTKLTLWHSIDKGFISMGAAGWHICLDVLNFLVSGKPIGRIVGPEAMSFGWPLLNQQYAEQFGIKPPKPPVP